MARHGENIRKRKDGRWEGRFPIYDKKKEKTVYKSVYGHTYDETYQKLTKQKSLMRRDFAQEWLAEIKNRQKPSTYTKYSTVYHTHIEPAFQDAVISELTDAFAAKSIPDHLSDSQ